MTNKRSIVIVEDDRLSRELLKCYIERAGFHPVDFERPSDAIEYLLKSEPNTVAALITDMMMSEGDGPHVLKSVRSIEKFEKLPILVCSGVDKQQYTLLLKEYNVSAFVHKPIIVKNLMENLRELTLIAAA